MVFPRSVQSFMWSKCREMSNPSTKKVPASLTPQVWEIKQFLHNATFDNRWSTANATTKNPIDVYSFNHTFTNQTKETLQSPTRYLWIEETTIKSLGWQLTTKDWRNWSCSVRSSASPPLSLSLAQHSQTREVQHDSFHSAPQATAAPPQPPNPCKQP